MLVICLQIVQSFSLLGDSLTVIFLHWWQGYEKLMLLRTGCTGYEYMEN